MKCIVSGGTGFIGRHLVRALKEHGHQVEVWGRTPRSDADRCDAIIQLAGEPVAQRWTPEAKRKIRDSRVLGTEALVSMIAKMQQRPSVLVCASAIGYYGSRGDEVLTEGSAAGAGFLADLCVEWEKRADDARALGLRVVKIRIGFVLGPDGGAIPRMLPAFKAFAGGTLGSGEQWTSWIHVDDLARMFRYAAEQPVSGVLNGTAPNPVTNTTFTEELGKAVHRPAIWRIPKVALRAMFGEMSEMMLASQRVAPRAAQELGFEWRFTDVGAALRDVL